jgi:hypothetical protein
LAVKLSKDVQMYVLNAMMATDLPDIVFYTHKGRFKIRSGLFLISSFQLLDTILVPLFGRLSSFQYRFIFDLLSPQLIGLRQSQHDASLISHRVLPHEIVDG